MNNNYFDLTIVIPTRNRPAFLERCIKYYADINFPAVFIIADSSGSEFLDRNRQSISAVSSDLSVHHMVFPKDEDFGGKISKAVSESTTEFTGIIGDDDFLMLGGSLECLELLKSKPDVVAVNGHRIAISALGPQKEGLDWVKSWPLWTESINCSDPFDRIRRLEIPSRPQHLYSFYRTNFLARSFHLIEDLNYSTAVEYFLYVAILTFGKWSTVPHLFSVCNYDSEYSITRDRESFPHYWGNVGSRMAQLSLPDFSNDVGSLSRSVGHLISEIEGGVPEENCERVREIFWVTNHMVFSKKKMDTVRLDHDQWIAKKTFSVIDVINRIFWRLVDRKMGVRSLGPFFSSLLREFLSGRLFVAYRRLNGRHMVHLPMLAIRRTRTVESLVTQLASSDCEWHDDFSAAFEAWSNNQKPS
ncbi:MAG: TIGR00180 family glycosyltransferase [Rhizobiaceae bacterium]